MHEENSFITLTYSPEFLPGDGCVRVSHFQDFIKRLRRRLEPVRIRFFHCGEYGEVCELCGKSDQFCTCVSFVPTFGRPHYHSLIFGFGFPDRVFFKEVNGTKLYSSLFLDDVWGMGHCSVGDVTFESSAYVARYCLKKVNGDAGLDHYWRLCQVTGEVLPVVPEYSTMSRRPGIGTSWYASFGDSVRKHDSVVVRGHESRPPRFYDQIFDSVSPMDMEAVRGLRDVAAYKRDFDNTPDRLRVREVVKRAQVSFLKRGYEHEA